MATTTLLANGGNDRLVVTTICSHLIFFHEAGFEYRTERKQRTPFAWWDPATWRGFRWKRSDDAAQPRDIKCTFNQDTDPSAFGATPQSSPGFLKLSCEHLSLRRHCVWVVAGGPMSPRPASAVGDDVSRVQDVVLQFTYDGQAWTLRHSTGGASAALPAQ